MNTWTPDVGNTSKTAQKAIILHTFGVQVYTEGPKVFSYNYCRAENISDVVN